MAGTQEPIYGPTAIQSVAAQAKTVPWTELSKDDLKWAAMTSDSGYIGMAQVIYSNVA